MNCVGIFVECGNTEAEGFICRFHLAKEKHDDDKKFFSWESQTWFSGKCLFEAGLPQGKAVNVACATVSPHSNTFLTR